MMRQKLPMLKGSLMLEGGSESHPQEISGIKLYNEEGKYSDGIQAGGASNGATYIELNQMQLGESTVSGNTNNLRNRNDKSRSVPKNIVHSILKPSTFPIVPTL